MIRVGLKDLLAERGMSQRELARRIGRHPDVISRFARRATGGVTYDLLGLICSELGCTPGALLCYDRLDQQMGLFADEAEAFHTQDEARDGMPNAGSAGVGAASGGINGRQHKREHRAI